MAKAKTKVEKRLSKPEKVTNEELNKIQNLVSAANKAQADIGNIEIQKHSILHQVESMQHAINVFREKMKKTYGTDDINIQTGVINYNKDEQTDKKD
jgi:predicted  nucleic acid-binding Zn-ribbon protein